MAQFQASLTLTQTDCVINVADASNYTNDTAGHAAADFSYIFIEITRPADSAVYRFESTAAQGGDGDLTIDPPATTLNGDWDTATNFSFLNGEYVGRIVVVPTFDAAETYANDSVVLYSGTLYYAENGAVGSNGTPLANTDDWVVVTVAEIISDAAYSAYTDTDLITLSCIVENTELFASTLLTSGLTDDIVVDVTEETVTFTIHSNYDTVVENGHDQDFFTDYRRAKLTKPDGTTYIWSSIADDGDAEVAAPSSNNNQLVYNVEDGDVDGVYKIELWDYPTWTEDTYYNSLTASTKVIVYHEGTLYREVLASLNVEPGTDVTKWVALTATDETSRYYYVTQFAIIYITLLPAWQLATKKAANVISQYPCEDDILCTNKCVMKAVKLGVLKDAIDQLACEDNWTEVQKAIDASNTIACCNDCG